MNLKPLTSSLTLAAALAFAGCSQYASVSERQPRFQPVRATVGALASVEQRIANALKKEKSNPLAAMGELLTAADTAAKQLARNPRDTAARNDYNFAVARVIGTIKRAKLDPWTQPLHVPAEGGEFVLTRKPDPRKAWNPALYDFTPADQLDIHGTYVTEHARKEGIGAPIVAVAREINKNAATDFSVPRVYYGVTAVIRFEGRRAVVSLEDPLAKEDISFAGHTHPLAADYTAPIALLLAREDVKKLELARLLRPEKYAETARLARLQPYDPAKIPVLCVHGLASSPTTWTPLLNALRADAELRKRYQFWFYSYPSGYPYPHSAAILRKQLDAMHALHPAHKKIVLIGHSMGSLISRLMITDSGDTVWLSIFGKAPAQTQLSPQSRELCTDALIFRHREDVGRAIFIAGPHRGSDLAGNWIGRIGSSLVRVPGKLLNVGKDTLKAVTFHADDLKLKRIPNSVDTLASNSRFVKTINTIPITPGIPYHSIIGDRGKGGNKDRTEPMSSDGFVPYWSSHLDGAKSELIVPSNHSAHQNALAIAEVKRILKLHAQ